MTHNSPHSAAVLFVDDEEKARKMFSRLVSPYFTVLTAEDVREAKELLEQKHGEIGVLITDQRMPGELGVDLLRHVRKEYPKIIRMLTTAYTDLNDAIEAVNTGEIFRYINKPWNADELLIDLRLAMNFFEIEQDRLQLIQEKVSLSHRQSRMEALKNLISMASAQNGFCCPKMGIKSFLIQVAEAQKVVEEGLDVSNKGYWEGEISKTEKMTRINSSLNEWSSKALLFLGANDAGGIDFRDSVKQANDVLSLSADLEMTSEVTHAVLGQDGINSVFRVIFQTLATSDQKVIISESDGNMLARFSASSPSDTLVTQLVKTDDPSGDKNIGDLIAVFILVSHLGGALKLHFDGSQLEDVELQLPQALSDANNETTDDTVDEDIQDNTWIEDMFVLYG